MLYTSVMFCMACNVHHDIVHEFDYNHIFHPTSNTVSCAISVLFNFLLKKNHKFELILSQSLFSALA